MYLSSLDLLTSDGSGDALAVVRVGNSDLFAAKRGNLVVATIPL